MGFRLARPWLPCVNGRLAKEAIKQLCTLSHLDKNKKASMVDVSAKGSTVRTASAQGSVHVGEKIHTLLKQSLTARTKKGDVLTVAQVGGIMGAKQTSNLIPLCHAISLSHVDVNVWLSEKEAAVCIEASATSIGQTGVEMEALTAVSIAALTVYDMCKSGGKGITIERIRLQSKTGGQDGDYSINGKETSR